MPIIFNPTKSQVESGNNLIEFPVPEQFRKYAYNAIITLSQYATPVFKNLYLTTGAEHSSAIIFNIREQKTGAIYGTIQLIDKKSIIFILDRTCFDTIEDVKELVQKFFQEFANLLILASEQEKKKLEEIAELETAANSWIITIDD